MGIDDRTWFSEICQEGGSAFSLKLKQKLHEEQTPFQRIEIFATEEFGNLSDTVSMGVPAFPEDAHSVQGLILSAAQALYRAKEAGRNRVMVATSA